MTRLGAPPIPRSGVLRPPSAPFPVLATDDDFCLGFRPGDVLLYNRNSFFNWVIRIKTWSRFSHVEVACPYLEAPSLVAAARNGDGCGLYTFDPHKLAMVLRPVCTIPPFERTKALGWYHANQIGEQPYDWQALLNFTYFRYVSRENGKMFCSEFATRFLRQGGIDLFPEHDADTIAPRDFRMNQLLSPVWRSQDEWARYHEQRAYTGKVA